MNDKYRMAILTSVLLSCHSKVGEGEKDVENPSDIYHEIKTIPIDKIEVITYDNCVHIMFKK